MITEHQTEIANLQKELEQLKLKSTWDENRELRNNLLKLMNKAQILKHHFLNLRQQNVEVAKETIDGANLLIQDIIRSINHAMQPPSVISGKQSPLNLQALFDLSGERNDLQGMRFILFYCDKNKISHPALDKVIHLAFHASRIQTLEHFSEHFAVFFQAQLQFTLPLESRQSFVPKLRETFKASAKLRLNHPKELESLDQYELVLKLEYAARSGNKEKTKISLLYEIPNRGYTPGKICQIICLFVPLAKGLASYLMEVIELNQNKINSLNEIKPTLMSTKTDKTRREKIDQQLKGCYAENEQSAEYLKYLPAPNPLLFFKPEQYLHPPEGQDLPNLSLT